MDLHALETYRCPRQLSEVTAWDPTTHWLAGGTWLFSQPQPLIKVLVDLQHLGWSGIEVMGEEVWIGATCPLANLLTYPWPPEWIGVSALQAAVRSLASFKVTRLATVGGNLCLALTVGSLAPVMIAWQARYQILHPNGNSRWIPALSFQTGSQQTLLAPGEVLRRVAIPITSLSCPSQFLRISLAATDPAVVMVVGCATAETWRFGMNAGVAVPQSIEISEPVRHWDPLLDPLPWLEDFRASAAYRRHLTQMLLQQCLDSRPS
ncbi:MAG: FAD binding domain-containing protein [Cyanobacteriota bacterium]|nr:FAD binding domain-containing protein [Cyanobacteriota bacterium]